jgi:hypothetical protein
MSIKMNKETIKNTVSFFLNCQKFFPRPKRLFYKDFKSLLIQVVDEAEFNAIIRSVFSIADHYFLLEKYKHPAAVLSDLNLLAGKINNDLNPREKLIFIAFLLKVIKLNNQENNQHLISTFYCLCEIFSYDQQEAESIWKLFISEEIPASDYQESILLTPESPDYCKIIGGMKVIYNPSFNFKIWIKNIKSTNNMLFKVLEFRKTGTSGIQAGDVLTFNGPVESLLNEHKITIGELASKINAHSIVPPRMEILATDCTPRVILNAAENRIEIEGISMSLQPQKFFRPVFHWLEKIKEHRPKELSIHVNLSFFNTYTSKVILNIFQKVMELEKEKTALRIYWYFEEGDHEMKDAGESYESILGKEFVYISTTSNELLSA